MARQWVWNVLGALARRRERRASRFAIRGTRVRARRRLNLTRRSTFIIVVDFSLFFLRARVRVRLIDNERSLFLCLSFFPFPLRRRLVMTFLIPRINRCRDVTRTMRSSLSREFAPLYLSLLSLDFSHFREIYHFFFSPGGDSII